MTRSYTPKDFKTDATIGLINGLFFSSIYSFFNLGLNKPYQPSAPWKTKTKVLFKNYAVTTSKLCLPFLAANLVYGYTKRKEFEEHYSFALAAATGFIVLTLVRI